MQTPLSTRRAFDLPLDRLLRAMQSDQNDRNPTAGGFVAALGVFVVVVGIAIAGWTILS
jgi:hypothetical protein